MLEPVLEALLDAGSDPNASTKSGGDGSTTVLIGAVEQGFDTNVRILLDRGADPNLPAPDGRTPLMVAAEHGHAVIVRDLLEHGADPGVLTRKGETARSLAERFCAELLGLFEAVPRENDPDLPHQRQAEPE